MQSTLSDVAETTTFCRGGYDRGQMVSNEQDSYGGQRQLSDRPWDGGRGQGLQRGPQPHMQMHPDAMPNGMNILAAVGQQVISTVQ